MPAPGPPGPNASAELIAIVFWNAMPDLSAAGGWPAGGWLAGG